MSAAAPYAERGSSQIVSADNLGVFLRSDCLLELVEADNEVLRGFTGTEPDDGFAHAVLPCADCDRMRLVTTKRRDTESADELAARIEEASRRVLERLALSTPCGFASNALGNEISVDPQRAELEPVVDVAPVGVGHRVTAC